MKVMLQLFVLTGVALLGLSCSSRAYASDDGAKIFTESCTPCHTSKMRPLDAMHLTSEQWKEVVDRMIDQGAEVSKGDKPALLDYLSRTHGPVSSGASTK